MKEKYELAIKYYTETNNSQQLHIAYSELEVFYNTYEKFKFFKGMLIDVRSLIDQIKPQSK